MIIAPVSRKSCMRIGRWKVTLHRDQEVRELGCSRAREDGVQGVAEKAGDGIEFLVPDGHIARKIAFQYQGPIPDMLTPCPSAIAWARHRPRNWAPPRRSDAWFRRRGRFGHAMGMTIRADVAHRHRGVCLLRFGHDPDGYTQIESKLQLL